MSPRGGVSKDPAKRRVMWSGRLDPETVATLRLVVKDGLARSQTAAVDQAIRETFGFKLWPVLKSSRKRT